MRPCRITLFALLTLTAACGGGRATGTDGRSSDSASIGERISPPISPPISEQSVSLRHSENPSRTVVHGDTLYSIAWETGRDYRELAKWNGISPPYTIKPGQELRVVPPVAVASAPVKPDTKSKAPTSATGKSSSPAAKASATKAAPSKPSAKTANTEKPKSESSRKTKTEPVKTPDAGKAGSWAWPTDGQLLKRYSESGSGKGIDIGGTRGQPIRATANGRVVYQGSGLRGYGQLIIVKHNDEFLSAYAHNDRIYVKEGDVVKRGQKIADMGSTGTDRVKLHFEIRRQGTPIDPLKYLSKR